jgi:EF hand associated
MQATAVMLSEEAVKFLTAMFDKRAHDGLMPLQLLLDDSGPDSFHHNAPPSPESQSLMRQVTQRVLFPTSEQSLAAPLQHNARPTSGYQRMQSSDRGGAAISLNTYLCIWAFCTMTDARATLAAMLYMGFPDTYDGCAWWLPMSLC